jgi:hypothetical protein
VAVLPAHRVGRAAVGAAVEDLTGPRRLVDVFSREDDVVSGPGSHDRLLDLLATG